MEGAPPGDLRAEAEVGSVRFRAGVAGGGKPHASAIETVRSPGCESTYKSGMLPDEGRGSFFVDGDVRGI